MTITNWPLNERPRERLLTHGPRHLTDAELLAILLQTGTQGKTALDLARELLSEFGSLTKLLNTPEIKKAGLGKAKHALLQAALEIGRRNYEEPLPSGEILTNSEFTKRLLGSRLRDYSHEVFACLFLNNRHRVLAFEELFHGTLTEASIYPREVIKRCLANNAAKIILAHNHPSGEALPSPADQAVTALLKDALAPISIRILDHIIIGHHDSFSFAETGLL